MRDELLIDLLVDCGLSGAMVEKIEHVHAVPAPAEPFHAADALLEPGRIPREIDVDQGPQRQNSMRPCKLERHSKCPRV
jgi:hypothetical protein